MNIEEIVARFDSELMRLNRNKNEFCIHPERDFTRNRKISFVSTVKSILAFGGGTLTN